MSNADLSNFALSRRDLLGKAASIALAATTAPTAPIAPTAPTAPTAPSKYPSPKFNIGDLIASDWKSDEDERAEGAPEFNTDFGEILGMRWLPERESGLDAKTWIYFVFWLHSTTGPSSCYPCYDGEASRECDLRLVV